MNELLVTCPGLLDARLLSRGKRVAYALLTGFVLALISGAVAAGVAWLMGWWSPRHWSQTYATLTSWPLIRLVIIAIVAVGTLILIGLFGSLWTAISGRNPIARMLGMRTVRADTGGHPGGAGFGRAMVMGILGFITAGLVPFILAMASRDPYGRHWQDRFAGMGVIDVRHGRDVTRRPPTPTEVRERLTAPRTAKEKIVSVQADASVLSGSPMGGPQAVSHPRIPGLRSPSEMINASLNSPLWGPEGEAADVKPGASPDPEPDVGGRTLSPIMDTVMAIRPDNAGKSSDTPIPAHHWLLRFDTGQTFLLSNTAVVGRSPSANPQYPGAALVRVEDASRTVSSSHLAVGGTDLGIWIVDLGSTNGSAVISKMGQEKVVSAKTRTSVESGGRVRLGDRVMRVEEARSWG
ncbi:MAG: hypothetical protein FWF43_01465 [Propionibacteriaceae bacterium]|nr:hypothetical protein [Propionibacteriaceae bacterium]